MSSGTNIAKKLSHKGNLTKSLVLPLSTAMSEHSLVTGTPQRIQEWLMLLQEDSRASHLVQQIQQEEEALVTVETCGPPLSSASAQYDHNLRFWRTFQGCSLADILEPFSATWPKAGMMRDGVFYPQPKWVRRIKEIGFGLWPTPRAGNDVLCGGAGHKKMLIGTGLEKNRGKLNPSWIEWLMGWPIGQSDFTPLAMESFRQWQQLHGIY